MKKAINLLMMTTVIAGAALAQTKTTDETALINLVQSIETGWNKKSGEAFSRAFADVHDYIVVNGLYFPGLTRQGNAGAHQGLFNGIYKKVDIRLKVDKISFIRPDLVMMHVIGASYETGTAVPKDPKIIMTLLTEKKNDEWKIISFHNHTLQSFEERERSPMPLEVMYKSWYKN